MKSGCEEASPEETLTAIVGEDGDLHLPQPVRHQPPLLPDLPPASDPGLGAGQVLARWRQADWQYVGLQRSAGLSIIHGEEKHLKLNTLLVKLDQSNVELLGEVVEAPVTPDL